MRKGSEAGGERVYEGAEEEEGVERGREKGAEEEEGVERGREKGAEEEDGVERGREEGAVRGV